MYNSPETLNSMPIDTLGQFELWVAQDWMYERGTHQAQGHVRRKLEEESIELAEALNLTNREEIVSELGDFLWTATANGLNVGITSSDALRHELGADQVGEGVIPLNQIDDLAVVLIPDLPVDQMADWVKQLSDYLGKAATQWRNLGPFIDTSSEPQFFSDIWIQLKQLRTYDALAQSTLIASALAQRYADATISDVVMGNVEKLQSRKALGLPVTSIKE